MEVEDGVGGSGIFRFEDHGADVFALVILHNYIYSLYEDSVDELFLRRKRVDVVAILSGRNDASPSSLERLSDDFHFGCE